MRYGLWVLFASLIPAATGPQPTDPVSGTFLQRIDEYVALHRRLEGPLPPEQVTSDVRALFIPRIALAAAIRAERADARHGEIFTPAIAGYFRTVITDALREHGIDDLLATVEEENAVHIPPRVNGEYPAGRSISTVPPCVLAALPPLPPELQYRFVGRDLILWDVHAGLIVDFVTGAIPDMTEE
jgi:hypothetical protein